MSAIPLSQLAMSDDPAANFLAVMPAVQNHARIRFRHLPAEQRQEAIAEAVAAAYVSYLKLDQQHKLPQAFVSTLAGYAVRHVVQGRHVGGKQDSAKCVLSSRAQKRHGFVADRLRQRLDGDNGPEGWRAAVMESRRVSPADQAAFNLDFERWMGGFSRRHQRIIQRLAAGERAGVIADRFGLSDGRVSQLRRKFQHAWQMFQGELTDAA